MTAKMSTSLPRPLCQLMAIPVSLEQFDYGNAYVAVRY